MGHWIIGSLGLFRKQTWIYWVKKHRCEFFWNYFHLWNWNNTVMWLRAVRYDDIYRMDEIKSLSFHIMFYRLFRGVAKYIVYAHTFSSFGWLRSLHATTGREGETEAGSEQEHYQPRQNEELVPKRGTTSVAWTHVLSTAVLKQPILSHWNANNRAMYAPSLFLCERSAHFFCRFIGLERLHKHNYMHKNPHLCKYPHKHSDLGLKRE